jgi:hypothetical protein
MIPGPITSWRKNLFRYKTKPFGMDHPDEFNGSIGRSKPMVMDVAAAIYVKKHDSTKSF